MGKKILITGATGLIGKRLCAKLVSRGDEITIFTRTAEKVKMPSSAKAVEWNYHNPDEWKDHLEGQDAIIHLAGINLFTHRWTDKFKSRILESRRVSTYNLSMAIINLKRKPEVFISASGTGYYGDQGNAEITESSPAGTDFLAEVCKVWESNAAYVEKSGVRRVSIRTGVVLSPESGALKEMLLPFRLFVGGPLGTGTQWFSWVHLSDVAESYILAVDNKTISGPVNVTSPHPVTMNEFAKTLGNVLNRPSLFKVPSFALKIIVGEAAEVVTYSQKVIPSKLISAGFRFRFPHLKEALGDLLR